MPLESALKSERLFQFPANPAPETPERKAILFFEILKKAFFGLQNAGNAGLAGWFILNVRKSFFLSVFPAQLGFTTPRIRHFRQPRFFPFSYAALHPTRP
jgi:hypothetical protein